MEWKQVCDRGIINGGNLYRFGKVFTRAENGERLKIGFLGGSITQGALAKTPQGCYAYLVYRWWQEHFPDAQFEYINAGIGATSSQFGAARVQSDLLRYKPDVLFVVFSVYDADSEFFRETFEGTVRRILTAESKPALFMFNNVHYNDGSSAQRVHNEIGKAYGLPIISIRESIYEELAAGRLPVPDITPDNLHPNDRGHRMVADVICNLLDRIRTACSGTAACQKCGNNGAADEAASGTCEGEDAVICDLLTGNGYFPLPGGKRVPFEQTPYIMPEQPLTANRFEHYRRYQNLDLPGAKIHGFTADYRPQDGVADVFKNGWSAMEEGSSFEAVVEASCISVQFRRTVSKPAPVARAVVDGNEENAVVLDANFDLTWGDFCCLTDIAEGLPYGEHRLRITIVQKPEQPANDFYLISILCA